MVIYCIPGLGVDYRVFSELVLTGYELKYIQWEVPHKGETLKDYALRLSQQMDVTNPFHLLGFSFGGMCATEIAKVYHPEKLVIISGAKSCEEIPLHIKTLKKLRMHTRASEKVYTRLAWAFRRFYGISKEFDALFKSMIDSMPPHYRQAAADCIINWQNKDYSGNILHIHGDRDVVIPFYNVKNPVRIKGGTHFMILTRAKEISKHIMEYLR